MEIENTKEYEVRPDVLNYDDIRKMVPKLDGHPKLVKWLMKVLALDKVNRVHGACCDTPGAEFCVRLLREQFRITMRVDNEQVLDHLPEGAFITVSNHPFGALDGIMLIALVGSRRPKYKVMVNMMLNYITAMRPNFIAVDAWASTDPKRHATSVNGIRAALGQIRDGEPLGFFPAGAMSKTDRHGRLEDRPWQDSVLQIIYRSKVPVIPIYFHGNNSFLFNLMGHICWPLRSLMLPREIFRNVGTTKHISIGNPITLEEQMPYRENPQTLGKFLRERTYALRDNK